MTAALARWELDRREEELARARAVQSSTSSDEDQKRVREAMSNTATWMRKYTRTFNPHWVEEGMASPSEPFPEHWKYFELMTELIEREKVTAFEKSRDMMVSWGIVAYFTRQAQLFPMREIVFQSIGETEAHQLIDYAKWMYDSQPEFLRREFPLKKATDKQSKNTLEWANGSIIWSVASGKDKIRSYHPWGFFQDEAGFQPEGLQCVDAALGTGCQKVVLASTSNVGWWFDWRSDNIEL